MNWILSTEDGTTLGAVRGIREISSTTRTTSPSAWLR